MHRQRMKTRALVLIAMLALGWAPFAQAQRQEVKEPATSGEPAKAKEKTLPATKQMDEASSVEKTGVPKEMARRARNQPIRRQSRWTRPLHPTRQNKRFRAGSTGPLARRNNRQGDGYVLMGRDVSHRCAGGGGTRLQRYRRYSSQHCVDSVCRWIDRSSDLLRPWTTKPATLVKERAAAAEPSLPSARAMAAAGLLGYGSQRVGDEHEHPDRPGGSTRRPCRHQP